MSEGTGPRTAATATKMMRKANKFAELTPDESFRDAVAYLDEAYGGDLPTSSQIRGDLDASVLALHTEFLAKLGAVHAQFTQVCNGVDQLAVECKTARRELGAIERSSMELMATADTLQAELDQISQREAQVSRFMKQFQLSREESDVLKEDVSPRFIKVLQKVQRIHASCKTMVLPEQQQAAIEIQEAMYLAQVAGVDKLARYVTHHVGDVFSADNPEVSEFLLSALGCLKTHAGPWEKAMHEIARVRKTTVLRRFLSRVAATQTASSHATGGGSRGGLRGRRQAAAADVVRLASDLCAWLHQAVAEETDTLTPLFDSNDDPAVATLSKADVLDQVFEGVCRHLRDRVQQALVDAGCSGAALQERVDPEAVLTLFKLEGLLGFYLGTTETLLGEHAALSECLRALRLDALRVFFESLQHSVKKTASVATVISNDLCCAPEVQSLLRVLREMMDHLVSSFVPHHQREADFAPVLGAVVDPIVSLADTAELPGTAMQDQHENARCVHKVNTICAVLAVVLPYDFAAAKQAKLTASLESILVGFTKRNAELLLSKFGITARITELSAGEVDQRALRDTVTSFFAYVHNLESFSVAFLDRIEVLRIRERVGADIARGVCDAYGRLYDLASEKLADDVRSEIFYHTPAQLQALLDVEAHASGGEAVATSADSPTS